MLIALLFRRRSADVPPDWFRLARLACTKEVSEVQRNNEFIHLTCNTNYLQHTELISVGPLAEYPAGASEIAMPNIVMRGLSPKSEQDKTEYQSYSAIELTIYALGARE